MNKVDEYYLNMQERLKAEDQLPILHVEVSGKVLASNLDRYRQDALALIDSVSTDLQTEDDFVSAGQAVKWCKTVEDRLDEAKAKALAQTDTIDELFKALDEIKSEARAKRLSLEKLIKNRKDEIRNDLVSNGVAEHANLMLQAKSLIKSTFCVDVDFYVPANFNGAVKNKRTVDSIKEAIEFELSKAKMQIDAKSLSVAANLARFFKSKYDGYSHIFHDISTICLLPGDEFDSVVSKRIEEAKIKEEAIKEQARIAEEKRQESLRKQEEAEEKEIDPGSIPDFTPCPTMPQSYIDALKRDPGTWDGTWGQWPNEEQKTVELEYKLVSPYQYTAHNGMAVITHYVEGLDVCEGFVFEDDGSLKRRLYDATAAYLEEVKLVREAAEKKRIL